MIGSKFMARAAALAIVLGAFCLTPATAEEGGAKQVMPKSPMKVELVDYIVSDDGPGTLKLAGIAIAGKDIYIYVDDQPLVKVTAADDGKWSIAEKTDLDDSVHKVRIEQFDDKTRLLAARVMFSMSLAKPGADGKPPAAAKP